MPAWQLEGTILKPNMVFSGKKRPKQASREEVAEKTLIVLKRCVPPAVPGIAFLSGGQSDEDATAHLHLHERRWALCPGSSPSPMAARCRRQPSRPGAGKAENVAAAQRAFDHRAQMNALAASGKWSEKLEKKAA